MLRDNNQLSLFNVAEQYDPRKAILSGDSVLYQQTYSIPSNATHQQFEPWFTGGNNETAYLMHLLTNNPLVLGLIITKCDILRGRRLALFDKNEKDSKGRPAIVELDEYPEIQDFYEYNDLNQWAYDAFMHHETVANAFSEGIFSKGSSQNDRQLIELATITPECVRAVRDKGVRKRIHHYGVSAQWSGGIIQKEVERIPAYDRKAFYNANREFQRSGHPNSVMFHMKRNLPHFPIYAVPRWYGARHWLETQNMVPIFHKSNLANMFGLRMQMNISRASIERMMAAGDGTAGSTYTEKEVLNKLAADSTKFFTNPNNAGKSLASAYELDDRGNVIKDLFFDKISVDMNDSAYSGLDSMMSQSVTSSMGTSPSLAGVITNNNLPSGSEQRYAWNIEVVKGAYIRDLILQPIRFAHKYNQWPSNLEWGFEQDVMVTADQDANGTVPQQTPE
jgi:hypothetical protein